MMQEREREGDVIHLSRWCVEAQKEVYLLMFLHFAFMRKQEEGGAKRIVKQRPNYEKNFL
jgi:hypothetical protein